MAEDPVENDHEWDRLRFRDDEEMDFFTELALHETERWIQAVTRKKFDYADDFRKSLSNGVLLCELLNNIKPGAIKRINKLPGAIAGLDNITVFLAACEKSFGLNDTQLFDPSDLEDLSNRAIADENEYLLKQETDRRSRNVAVTIYWLGREVSNTFKGPALDTSAFSALVHSHGNKNIITNDCFKNGNSRVTQENPKNNNSTHIRDSSYDSLGSYERESESSFDELDHSGNMPVRSDMREMRRYNSASSLSMPRDLKLSTASHDSVYSDDKQDSMYQSSPDLSQGDLSLPHTRSSSTDSAEGGYYGNHSRQSSGSTGEYPARRKSTSARKVSTSTPDPLQFVKLAGAQSLAQTAKKQMEVAKEVNMMRGKVDASSVSEEPDWQSNFNNWKSRRKSTHSHVLDDVPMEEKEEESRKIKPFSQIMAEKQRRSGMGLAHIYPLDDDDSGIGINKPRDKPVSNSSQKPTEKKSHKIDDVAPWARDSSGEDNSQSDSETNNSHQSGDTDSVFSDKSTPSKLLSDDDSWTKKQNSQFVPSKVTPLRTQKADNVSKLWESNVNESQRKDDRKMKDIPTKNSAKIKDITKTFEQKDKDAHSSPTIVKRQRSSDGMPPWKSLDLTDGSSHRFSTNERKPTSPLSPNTPKSLLPRDQRFHHNDQANVDILPNMEKLSVSQSPRDRYLQNVSPVHQTSKPTTKTFGSFTSPTSSNVINKSAMGPKISAKPAKSKILAAKAMFEKSNEEELSLPNPGKRKNQNNRNNMYDTTEDKTVNKNPHIGDINFGETVCEQENHFEEGTTENKEIIHENVDTADHELGFELTKDPSYICEHAEIAVKCVEIEDTLFPSREVHTENIIVCNDIDNISNIAEEAVANALETIVAQELEYVNSEFLHEVDQEDGYQHADLTHMVNVQNPVCVEDRSDVNVQKPVCAEDDTASSCDDASEDQVQSEEQKDVSDDDFDVPEYNPCDEQRVVQERSEELLSNEDLVRDQLLEDVTVNDDVDGEDVTVNDNVDGLVDEQSENNDNNQDGESEVEDDSDVQDLCNAYEHVLFEAVENDEEVETYEADLFDIDEVDEANFVPDLPKSQIPPDLPRSQIPDIIESNSKDLSFESDVSDTLRPDSNMGVEQNDILLIDGPAIQNMAVEEEEKDCSPWIEEQSNSSVPLIGDCHFDLNMGDNESGDSDGDPKKFVEKVIKISQRPNNNRGFGFTLVGGMEKRQPVTVQRVSLGSEASDDVFYDDRSSAADVQDVLANDELTEVNGKDVATLTLAQVQGIVDHAVKRGQIELKIKRFAEDESYDSMEEEEANMQSNNNRSGGMDVQSDSSLSADPPSLEEQHVSQILLKTDETGKPRLMDQLIGEKQRETNNNEKNVRAPSPVSVEPPATVEIALTNETIPSRQLSINARDICAPTDVTLTEDRSTITVRRSTANYESDHSPVVMRRERTPLQSSPAPPTPPRNEPPPLSKANNTMNSDGDSSGFGPPAALMRWQRPRAKSEYQNPFPSLSSSTREQDRFKRLSSTLPYSSAHTFSFDKDYSKDDTEVDKVSKDFVETVSVTKPLESNPNSYQFNDTSRIEEWQQKQDQQRMPKPYQPIELHIPKEENLTAQSAAPARKVAQIDAPDLGEINVQKYEAPLSPQDKFEKDQQRIRQRYEDEKKKAKQSEQFKQTQERQVLNSDKFMQSMESQIMQTKQEAANQNLLNSAPIREPRFTSEPMKMKIPANSQGRPLMIDPRNQADSGDNQLPEYSFRVDLSKTESAPPLRTLNTQQDISPEQLLERERERIREEEKQKLDEERQQWLQEQERQKNEQERKLREKEEKIRQEQERLQREQERVEHERALLEQKKAHEESLTPRYQPVNNTSLYLDSRSPTGSSSSSISPTSRHSAPALDPKHHESSRRVPPPTAPKPDKGAKEKARLTREDLLAMNRKATPLTKPDSLEPSGHNDSLSPTTREAPSKRELHSLNAVPKPKFHSSAAWMKDTEDTVPTTNSKYSDTQQNEKPFVIGKRSDLIHQRDYSNPSDHWLVREAEKRRLADKRDNVESVTAHAGPTKPSQSSLVSRFRSDIEPPPRRNRFSYPSSQFGDPRDVPSRPLSTSGSNLRDRNPEKGITTQFSARSQPSTFASNSSLSQTLPPSFSFNANARNHNAAPLSKPPRSLTDDSDPVIAVNGKQKCSHCGEELGFGAAMVIESLGLYYHVQCFRCCVCHMALGNGSEGADVRVRVDKLHCKNCYSNDEAGLKFSKV